MISNVYIFRRIEKKYVISEEQYLALLGIIGERLIGDAHGRSTVNSLYLDTPDYRLIRASIEAKNEGSVYKEKLRVRSYGISSDDSGVFFEIKKKYAGVVYKRRVLMKLSECMEYIACGKKPFESQIMNEIDYAMTFYGNPTPRTLLSYEREAYFAREAPDLRITFDRAIRYRSDGLSLKKENDGKKIISDDEIIMEIKTGGGMPLWLSSALGERGIYPSSFSKYGSAYRDMRAPVLKK